MLIHFTFYTEMHQILLCALNIYTIRLFDKQIFSRLMKILNRKQTTKQRNTKVCTSV